MKKVSKFLILFFAVFTLLYSCKKDSSNITGTTGNIIYNPPAYSNIFGVFSAVKEFYPTNTNFYSICGFYSVPKMVLYDTLNTQKINFIKFNGTYMVPDSGGTGGPYEYRDTTPTLIPISGQWEVAGIGSIPSFTLASVPFPTYTGFGALPDTIHKNQNLALNLSGISGADCLQLYLDGGLGHFTSPVYLIANTYTISSASMLNFSNNVQGNVTISFYKRIVTSISGKNFVSTLTYNYGKSVVFVN